MFAKLFESPRHGQILVKIDTDSDRCDPEVRFYTQPKDLGVCSFAIGFKDSDEGWEIAEEVFAKIDLARAEDGIDRMLENLQIAGLNIDEGDDDE